MEAPLGDLLAPDVKQEAAEHLAAMMSGTTSTPEVKRELEGMPDLALPPP
eukprot:COSAG04_NODE_3869_length_2460_cov_1.938162_3_plen_49_part_01